MGQDETSRRVASYLIKKWEGLHKKGKDGLIYPYVCPAGVWTIGYGSTRDLNGLRVTKDTGPYTEEQCSILMLRELDAAYNHALRMSPILANYEEALGAVCSFIFNLGASRYFNSTLRRRVNEGKFEEASNEIKKWVWGGGRRLPGLVARRQEESTYLLC